MPNQAIPFAPSADAVLSVVRVHADRVHDAVRRLGCGQDTAIEVVATSALDLVDAVARDPADVGDPVGWWFARAWVLAHSLAGDPDDALPVGGGVLSSDANQARLAVALEASPELERAALLLRDSYALPAAAVGTALDLDDAQAAMDLVGYSRLAFLPALLGSSPVPLGEHSPDLAALARLAEGGPGAARDATTRRHAQACDTCSAVLDVQERAHRLLSGLTVVALPADEREALLSTVEARAHQLLLPAVAQEPEEWDDEPHRIVPLSLIALGLVLAVGSGMGIGLYASKGGAAPASAATGGAAAFITPAPALTPAVRPAVATAAPTATPHTRVFTLTPSPTPTPTPTATTPSTANQVALNPTSGPNGQVITVTGTGWVPGSNVKISYRDPQGQLTPATAAAVVDAAGNFTAALTATDPSNTPGLHFVEVTDGTSTSTATFTATG